MDKTRKPEAPYSAFEALDIRMGRIISVREGQTKKPTYRLEIDFGEPIGKKVSCGAYRNYAPEKLVGAMVICVVNFAPKKMGPELSEALVLGVSNEKGETIYLTPQDEVPLGAIVF